MGTRRRRVSVIRSRSKPVQWDDLRMEFISNCTADVIANAAKALIDGHLVAFPTETVYGLGADATNEKAVSRIYSVKGRPVGHPLIVHISSINKLEDWATDIPDYAIKLARAFWPGPMTLILPRKELAKNCITGGQNNVGLRVPAQPVALALLKKFEDMGGRGIAAPSANRFGAVSPTTAHAVNEELGAFFEPSDFILDGGPCLVGIESTIIDCTYVVPRILRPGTITKEMIEHIAGISLTSDYFDNQVRASGMSIAHYSPKAKVKIGWDAKPGEGFIALSSIKTPLGAVRLISPHNNEQYAQMLYEGLRKADQNKINKVVVVPAEGNGLALAINDRLKKSAEHKVISDI
jgi:L-threonylcarbamoyladenylate synthase